MNINDFNSRLEVLEGEYIRAGYDKSEVESEITSLVEEVLSSEALLPSDQVDLLVRVHLTFPESERVSHNVSKIASSQLQVQLTPEFLERRQVLQAVKEDGMALRNVPEKFKKDREIVEIALMNNMGVWDLLSEEMRDTLGNDPNFLERMIDKWGGFIITQARGEARSDGALLMKALDNPWTEAGFEAAFQLAQAAGMIPAGLPFVPGDLEDLKIVARRGILDSIPDKYKDSEEFILDVLKRWGGTALNFVSLSFASDRLKDDPEFMLEAMEISPSAIFATSDRLRDDAEFMLKAIDLQTDFHYRASDRLLADADFMSKVGEKRALEAKRELPRQVASLITAGVGANVVGFGAMLGAGYLSIVTGFGVPSLPVLLAAELPVAWVTWNLIQQLYPPSRRG